MYAITRLCFSPRQTEQKINETQNYKNTTAGFFLVLNSIIIIIIIIIIIVNIYKFAAL